MNLTNKPNLNDHSKRWKSGLLIAFFGFSSLILGDFYFLILICFLLWTASKELLNLIKASGANPPFLLIQILCVLSAVFAYISPQYLSIWLSLTSFIIICALLLKAFKQPQIKSSFTNLAFSFLALIYIGWLPAHIILLRQIGFSAGLPILKQAGLFYSFFVISSIVFNDIASYYAGKIFGKTKLAQSISPNKTIKGSIAGILIGSVYGILLGLFVAPLFNLNFSFFSIFIVSLICNISAQIGDLAESLMKRAVGVKDAGQTFEGYGGVLDRFDSHLFACQIAYYFFFYHHLGYFK